MRDGSHAALLVLGGADAPRVRLRRLSVSSATGPRRIVAVYTCAETLRPLLGRLGLDAPPAVTRVLAKP